MQHELDVDGVGGPVGVDQRVAALVQLVAIGEPHPDPLGRMQRSLLEQPAGGEAEPQVVRADLGPSGDGQLVVARAEQLEHGAREPARLLRIRHGTSILTAFVRRA